MTTMTLTRTVVEEAEAIVRAEWTRLQYDNGPNPRAVRHCSIKAATMSAIAACSGRTVPVWRARWTSNGETSQRVWPTQRSPPQHCGVSPKTIAATEVMHWTMSTSRQ
ncbi:hypothetical protein BH09ACT8_BH09ACT8_48100 [soil metagenome]